MSSGLYPITLNRMGERAVLVVGGGPVGARKARGVLDAGGAVVVVSPEVVPALRKLVAAGAVEWRERDFVADDLSGVDLVFAATNVRAVNAEVARLARERRVLCNVADMPSEGDFHSAAVLRKDGLVIGVNNERREPRRAVKVRDAIGDFLSKFFGTDYAD